MCKRKCNSTQISMTQLPQMSVPSSTYSFKALKFQTLSIHQSATKHHRNKNANPHSLMTTRKLTKKQYREQPFSTSVGRAALPPRPAKHPPTTHKPSHNRRAHLALRNAIRKCHPANADSARGFRKTLSSASHPANADSARGFRKTLSSASHSANADFRMRISNGHTTHRPCVNLMHVRVCYIYTEPHACNACHATTLLHLDLIIHGMCFCCNRCACAHACMCFQSLCMRTQVYVHVHVPACGQLIF